ncbi:histidine phosphatase family protein [Rarobacter faecitabidus]
MKPSRTLVLIRHAKAESQLGAESDHVRPLALKGRSQASQLGRDLAAQSLIPQVVLCSSALRTRQTWELVSGTLLQAVSGSHSGPQVLVTDDLYSASSKDLIGLVQEHGGDASIVFVVGHEPTISMAADSLAGAGSESAAAAQVRVGVPTGTACILRVGQEWSGLSRSSAVLEKVFRPAI